MAKSLEGIQSIAGKLEETQHNLLVTKWGPKKVTLVKDQGEFKNIEGVWAHVAALVRALFNRDSSYFRGEQEAVKSLNKDADRLITYYSEIGKRLGSATSSLEIAQILAEMRDEEGDIEQLKETILNVHILATEVLHDTGLQEKVEMLAGIRFKNALPSFVQKRVGEAQNYLGEVKEAIQRQGHLPWKPEVVDHAFDYFTYRAAGKLDPELEKKVFGDSDDQQIYLTLSVYLTELTNYANDAVKGLNAEAIEGTVSDLLAAQKLVKERVAALKEWQEKAPQEAKAYLDTDKSVQDLYAIGQRLGEAVEGIKFKLEGATKQVDEGLQIAKGEHGQAAGELEAASKRQLEVLEGLSKSIGEAVGLQKEGEATGIAAIAKDATTKTGFVKSDTDVKRVELLHLLVNAPDSKDRILQLIEELELDLPESFKVASGQFLNHSAFKGVVDALFEQGSVVSLVGTMSKHAQEQQQRLIKEKEELDGEIKSVLAGPEFLVVSRVAAEKQYDELLKGMQILIGELYTGWFKSQPEAKDIVDVGSKTGLIAERLSRMIELRNCLGKRADVVSKLEAKSQSVTTYGNFVDEMIKLKGGFEAANTQRSNSGALKEATRKELEASAKLKAAELLVEKVGAARQLLA